MAHKMDYQDQEASNNCLSYSHSSFNPYKTNGVTFGKAGITTNTNGSMSPGPG